MTVQDIHQWCGFNDKSLMAPHQLSCPGLPLNRADPWRIPYHQMGSEVLEFVYDVLPIFWRATRNSDVTMITRAGGEVARRSLIHVRWLNRLAPTPSPSEPRGHPGQTEVPWNMGCVPCNRSACQRSMFPKVNPWSTTPKGPEPTIERSQVPLPAVDCQEQDGARQPTNQLHVWRQLSWTRWWRAGLRALVSTRWRLMVTTAQFVGCSLMKFFIYIKNWIELKLSEVSK